MILVDQQLYVCINDALKSFNITRRSSVRRRVSSDFSDSIVTNEDDNETYLYAPACATIIGDIRSQNSRNVLEAFLHVWQTEHKLTSAARARKRGAYACGNYVHVTQGMFVLFLFCVFVLSFLAGRFVSLYASGATTQNGDPSSFATTTNGDGILDNLIKSIY